MSGKGDKPRPIPDRKQYEDNWDAIFGKKNQKHKQQDLTELNGDGNRDRGRYGEDLMWEHYCTVESTLMGVEKGEPCNWCGMTEK